MSEKRRYRTRFDQFSLFSILTIIYLIICLITLFCFTGLFLPFKTPLDRKFDRKLSPTDYFTPEMLIASMKSFGLKIGLWIDLTNTNRYYDKEIIEKQGISYLKLAQRGHGEAPNRQDTAHFIARCYDFTLKNPSSIIAVHCTHGFNRTGFLICAYLVEKLGISFN